MRKDCANWYEITDVYDVTSPGTGTDNSNKTAGKEEIRQEMTVSWMAAEEKWRSVQHQFVCCQAPSIGCIALHPSQRKECMGV